MPRLPDSTLETLLSQVKAAVDSTKGKEKSYRELSKLKEFILTHTRIDKESLDKLVEIVDQGLLENQAQHLIGKLNEYLMGEFNFQKENIKDYIVKNPIDEATFMRWLEERQKRDDLYRQRSKYMTNQTIGNVIKNPSKF